MSTLQDFINRRNGKPSSRPNSPQKLGPAASRIPLSRADIAKAHSNGDGNHQFNDDEQNHHAQQQQQHHQQLQDGEFDDSDFDTRDSELESLANLDHRGFDNDSSDGESTFHGVDMLGPDGQPVRVEGGSRGGWMQSNGNSNAGNFAHGGRGNFVAQDERSDGTATPRPMSDEENLQRDAAAQYNRGLTAAASSSKDANFNHNGVDDDDSPPQHFYTSLEIDRKGEEDNNNSNDKGNARNGTANNGTGNQNGTGTIRQQKMADRLGGGGGGGAGDRSWQDLDDEFRKSGGRIDGESIPFNVDGMLELVGQRLKRTLRGSARLTVTDYWFPYKILTIQSPSLPYFIWIPPAPHTALEIARMTSEIATMAFVRRYHPSIPVPDVVFYESDVNNLAGVPFFVTKSIQGQFVGYTNAKDLESDRRTMMSLLDQLAKIHTELLKPPRGFTPTHIGNIMFRNDYGGSGGKETTAKNIFTTGPLLVTIEDDSELLDNLSSLALSPSSSSSPSSSATAAAVAAAAAISSLPDLCMHLFQVSESRTLMDPPRDPKSLRELRSVKRRLAGLLGILPQLPNRLSNLSLFHASLNLSSLVIDPRTKNVTCVPIWRDACILPFALAVSYPKEIRPKSSEWNIWVDDATEGPGARIDENFGYRSVYDARMAKHDLRFASDVWEDEDLGRWVKVYELVGGGWKMWTQRMGWIEAELETARRM